MRVYSQIKHEPLLHLTTNLLQRGFLGYVQRRVGLHEDLVPWIDIYCN